MPDNPSKTKTSQIENNFTYRSVTKERFADMATLRQAMKELAFLIESTCPASREKSLAFTKLEECMMWANASIARDKQGDDDA